MFKLKAINIAVTIALFGGSGLSAALAQETAPEEPKQELFEIIQVTANRTVSDASKTPVAVTAIGEEALRNSGVTNPTALGDVIPNVSIDRTNGLQITIRGVTSTDNTEKGDPSAAFLVDGVYIARPQVQEVSFFDIDRVEVLRGPQGTLYGRNTTAGVVNIISAKPRDDFEGAFNLAYGNYGNTQADAMLNLPVTEDLAIRAAISMDTRDSFLKSMPTEQYNNDPYKENIAARFSALYQINNDISLLLRADYATMQGVPQNTVLASNFYNLPFTLPVGEGRGIDPEYRNSSASSKLQRNHTFAVQPDRDNSTWGLHAELDWMLSDYWTLSYLGSTRKFRRDEYSSNVMGVRSNGDVFSIQDRFYGDYEQTSHELRFAFQDDQLSWQGGAYYFSEESDIYYLLEGYLAPNPGESGYIFGFPQSPTKAKSLAFFSQATYSLTDDLRVTGGIRHTSDDKSRFGATIIHSSLDEPLAYMNNGRDSLNLADRNYKKTTWKLGADYDLTEKTMIYGSVATGYKAGGFNDGCTVEQAGCVNPLPEEAVYYDPETLTAYEIGVKSRIGNTLMLNSNFFHYKYEGLQLSQSSTICGGPCQVTTNAAAALVDGVEIEGIYRPNMDSTFNFAFTWLDARYDDYQITPEFNFAGEQLSRSPEFTVSLGYKYSHELANGGSLDFGINSKWSDEYVIYSNEIRANFRQPSFRKTDITLTYNSPDGDWYAQLYGKNLENEITVSSVGVTSGMPALNDGTVAIADPRLFGVRFGMKF